jgi:hypothetical protein
VAERATCKRVEDGRVGSLSNGLLTIVLALVYVITVLLLGQLAGADPTLPWLAPPLPSRPHSGAQRRIQDVVDPELLERLLGPTGTGRIGPIASAD